MVYVQMISFVRRNGGDDSNVDSSCCNGSSPNSPGRNNTNAGGSRLVARGDAREVTSSVDGLPEGHDKATTYGNGKKSPILIKSGPEKGWHIGGGLRKDVYGYTWVFTTHRASQPLLNFSYSFHPRVPALMTLPWGFVPIATFLDTYPSDSNLHRVSAAHITLATYDANHTSPKVLRKLTPERSPTGR